MTQKRGKGRKDPIPEATDRQMRDATKGKTAVTQQKPKPRDQRGRVQKWSSRREKTGVSMGQLFECGIPDKAQSPQALSFLQDQVIISFSIKSV